MFIEVSDLAKLCNGTWILEPAVVGGRLRSYGIIRRGAVIGGGSCLLVSRELFNLKLPATVGLIHTPTELSSLGRMTNQNLQHMAAMFYLY